MSGSKIPLLIIFVTVFIDLLGFGIVLPLLPRYGEFYKATDLQLGLLVSSFSAMQFLFAPVWGRISDRVGRRPILLIGLLGSTGSYALFSYVSQMEYRELWLGMDALTWLLISRIGAGIAGATIPTAQAYIADSTATGDRGKGMALIGAAFGIGFVFGPLIGAVSLKLKGTPDWRPGAVAAALSGAAFLFALMKLPESLRRGDSLGAEEAKSRTGLRQILTRPDLLSIMLTMFLTTFAFAEFESTLSRLTRVMGLGDASNYYVFAYLGVALLICQGFLVRRWLPRWGEYKMAMTGAVLMMVSLPLIGFAGNNGVLWQLLTVLPLVVMGFAALNPSLQSSLSLRVRDDEQGEILGFGQSASALARVFGPLCGNSLFGINHAYPYFTGGALMVIGLICVIVAGRGNQRSPNAAAPAQH